MFIFLLLFIVIQLIANYILQVTQNVVQESLDVFQSCRAIKKIVYECISLWSMFLNLCSFLVAINSSMPVP